MQVILFHREFPPRSMCESRKNHHTQANLPIRHRQARGIFLTWRNVEIGWAATYQYKLLILGQDRVLATNKR
jgi:hypothetical protein